MIQVTVAMFNSKARRSVERATAIIPELSALSAVPVHNAAMVRFGCAP
jgi:hypothetical protein